MRATRVTRKAAQYVRMSTEQQQYSTINQKSAIAVYAAANGIEIVATYEDSGKSGLTLVGRPALRQLLADVATGQDKFDTILVYDVSRWGRFQDADESAHLEYLCRLSGVRFEYCAEPFANDGTPFASICKVVKRALAAEYSRELSDKVFIGQRRLIEQGFKQGGSAGLGLRRFLIDRDGHHKGILAPGEYKSIATDRVILVPGPAEEVALVQRIYRDYLDYGLGYVTIARTLNRECIKSESGRSWTRAVVKRILTSPKYVGDNVWGRTSFKLQIARRSNSSETWVRSDGAFEGIISRATFEKAQEVRAARAVRLSDEQIVARLSMLYRKHGRITARLIKNDAFVGVLCIRKRFGSLIPAYERAGFRPQRDLDFLAHNRAARTLRAATAAAILAGLRGRGQHVERLSGGCRFLVNNEIRLTVSVVQQRRSQRGAPRWLIKPAESTDDIRLAVLRDGHSERPRRYYIFPSPDLTRECLLGEHNPVDIEVLQSSDLAPLFDLCAREHANPVCDNLLAAAGAEGAGDGPLPPLPHRQGRKSRASLPCKTYAGAFKRASKYMRAAISRAEAVARRLEILRSVLAALMAEAEFRRTIVREGIETVPYVINRPQPHVVDAAERRFVKGLREAASEFAGAQSTAPRVRRLLAKLNDRARLEAAEMIVFVNDPSEQFARALVAATPVSGLQTAGRKHIYGADAKSLKRLFTEREVLLREAKQTFASAGRNALELVAVEGFARRLLATQCVASWLQANNKVALSTLASAVESAA